MDNRRTVKKCWRKLADTSGALLMEAVFILSLLMTLSMAVADYGFYLVQKTRVQAINHSLSAVLRERTVFFTSEENLTQKQLSQITELAKTLLGPAQASRFCLTTEMLTFKEGVTKTVAANTIYYGGATGCRLQPKKRLIEISELSPFSSRSRWMPLYQVTLSTPVPRGTLHRLLQGVGALPENFTVSNVVIPR